MLKYTINRILSLVPVLLVVSITVFMIVHLTPGNPALVILGEDASAESIIQLEHQLGLDQPIFIRFFEWLFNVLQGDLGTSIFTSEPVLEIILNRIGPTLSLTVLSLILTLTISIPLAIFTVWKRNTFMDPLFISASLLGVSLPEFWLAILLVMTFAVAIPILPVAGYIPISDGFVGWIYHLILPAFILAAVEIGLIARMLRDGMLESIHKDYTRTARAKGLREGSVLMKHVFANALIPTTTVLGNTVAGLMGGTVIIETIFTIPGIGQLLVDSIYRRDYPVVQGVILFIASMYVLVNLVIDFLYTLLDPRIRYD
ncbi:Glutathione transport system permease protein GsiC [compost metagenome]